MPDLFKILPDPACMFQNIGAAAEKAFPAKELAFEAPCKLLEHIGFSHGFPEPGDPKFCGVLEDSTQAFEHIVELAEKLIELSNLSELIADALQIPLKEGVASSAYNLFAGAWNSLIKGAAHIGSFVIRQVITVLKEVLNIHSCVVPQKYRKAHQGVWILKQLLHLIENVRVGVDPGIWATVDIHPQFDLVKEWLDKVENYFAPIQIASPLEATRAWLLNRISTGHRNCIWRLHGLDPHNYEHIALSEREQLDWREAVQYIRRQGFGEGDEDAELRARGFVTEHDRAMAKEMYWELPGISDHLHWLQRNVFDTNYIIDYRLLDGFDANFWPKFGKNLTALGMREEYAKLHYAAHWIMPSPEQMKVFLYRSEEIVNAGVRPFTLPDYERILAEQDYNPLVREWFAATAYQVPAISYIKDWFKQDIIGPKELASYHRKLGFNPQDADNFVKIDTLQKERMRAAQTHGWTTKAATEAWVNGQIPENQQEALYEGLGYTRSEAANARRVALTQINNRVISRARTRTSLSVMTSMRNALLAGIVSVQDARDMLVQSGWPKDLAFSYASTQGIEARTRAINQAITYLKRMVLQGVIDFSTAARELGVLGVDQFAVQQYLTVWRLQLTPGRRRRSSTEVVRDLANGHIDRPTAIAMLQNLGYTNIDTMLYLADAQDKMVKVEQGRLKAAQKAGLARSKQIALMQKAATKQSKDLLKQLMRQESPAGLKRWAKLGIIGKDYFMRRYAQYGYTRDEAEKHYTEACKAKGQKCVDITPGTAGRDGESTGGGSTAK